MEDGREIIMVGSKERNNGGKTAILVENDTIQIPQFFHLSSLTQVVFLFPYGKGGNERALFDLGASICIMPFPLFYKLYLRPLLAAPFSLQLVDGFMT